MGNKEARAGELFADNYNCAQSVIGAFCEGDGLDLATALKMANGFGGGLRCGEVCGAVSGAIMAIGLKCGFYTKNDMEQKNYCNAKTYEFIEKFQNEQGSILCRELFGVDIRKPEDHLEPPARERHKYICHKLVSASARILEDMEFK